MSDSEHESENFTDELESICKELEVIIESTNQQLEILEELRYKMKECKLSKLIVQYADDYTLKNTQTWGEFLIDRFNTLIVEDEKVKDM